MQILNLASLQTKSVSEKEDSYIIEAEKTSPPLSCPHCGCVPHLYHFGTRKQIFIDLPVHAKQVAIILNLDTF